MQLSYKFGRFSPHYPVHPIPSHSPKAGTAVWVFTPRQRRRSITQLPSQKWHVLHRLVALAVHSTLGAQATLHPLRTPRAAFNHPATARGAPAARRRTPPASGGAGLARSCRIVTAPLGDLSAVRALRRLHHGAPGPPRPGLGPRTDLGDTKAAAGAEDRARGGDSRPRGSPGPPLPALSLPGWLLGECWGWDPSADWEPNYYGCFFLKPRGWF